MNISGSAKNDALKYNSVLDASTNNSVSVIAQHIKPGSTVLELGPATGYMTRFLKESLGCAVSCIEIDANAAQIAEQYSVKMIVADLDSMKWAEQLQGTMFDNIIFADVLEHLRNPADVLKQAVAFLKPSGFMFISVPNIGHNAIIMELLQGRFEYQSTGLLDNTHIHFFTRKSLTDMLHYAGLQPCEWVNIKAMPANTEFQQDYNVFSETFRCLLQNRKDAEAYQFVTISQPKADVVSEKGIEPEVIVQEKHLACDQLQLFWETAKGYSEDHSIRIPFADFMGFSEFTFILPTGKSERLRFDPGSRPAYVEIKEIQLFSQDTSEPCHTYSMDNRFSGLIFHSGVAELDCSDHLRFLCTNCDPQIMMDFAALPRQEAIHMVRVQLKMDWRVSEMISNNVETVLLKKQLCYNELQQQKQGCEAALSECNNTLTMVYHELAERNNQTNQLNQEITYLNQEITHSNQAITQLNEELVQIKKTKLYRLDVRIKSVLTKYPILGRIVRRIFGAVEQDR